MSKIIRCRTISEGYGEGEAIVSRQALGFNHGVDLETGRIKEIGHELEGQSIKGKVFRERKEARAAPASSISWVCRKARLQRSST